MEKFRILTGTHANWNSVVSFSLKTSDRIFNIYNIFTLPYKIAELNKYVQMTIDSNTLSQIVQVSVSSLDRCRCGKLSWKRLHYMSSRFTVIQ
jgi:hypothetical protein